MRTLIATIALLFATTAHAQIHLAPGQGDGSITSTDATPTTGESVWWNYSGVRPATSVPSAPAAGSYTDFRRERANRVLEEFIDEFGIGSPYQPALWAQDWCLWGAGNAVALATNCAVSTTGTASTPTPASTNARTRMRRATSTGASALDTSVEFRSASGTGMWRGDSSGLGGFYAVLRFSSGSNLDGERSFIGLNQSSSAIGTTLEPSTLTNMIGAAHDDDGAGGNWVIMHNDGSGTATSVTLGANFPQSSTTAYELILFAAPNASVIDYHITNLGTGNVASGQLSTNLPVNTGFFHFHVWANSGTTNGVVIVEYGLVYGTTPRHGDIF